MNIPGLGEMTKHPELDWYYSKPLTVPVLGGKTCRIIVEAYGDDPNPTDFHTAIANFLSIPPSVLREAEPHVFRYYEKCNDYWEPEDAAFVAIRSPSDVWQHIQFGDEPVISRRAYGDKGVYVSLECSCDWEREHGLQIVFKNGLRVNKVGEFDGHLTNSDAYADESLEEVIYAG